MMSPRKYGLIKRLIFICFVMLLLGILLYCFICRSCTCRKEEAPETSDSLESESVIETTSQSEEETESEEESKTDVTSETEEENTEKEDTEQEASGTAYGYFFGKRMDARLLEINKATLSDPGSRLVDLFTEKTYTAAEVLDMIHSYKYPEKAWYGDRQDIPKVQDELTAYMNLSVLEEMKSSSPEDVLNVRYGILTDNASVRSFPTDLRAHDTNDSAVWDYFQETKLLYGDGVIVLHETADRVWSFVQGLNYFGWIRTAAIAFCTYDQFLDFLTQDQFLVRVTVFPEDASPLNRLGIILPLTGKDEDGISVTVLLPERADDGTLKLTEALINIDVYSACYHEGFLSYSPENLLQEARRMLGFPYGYGDLNSNYDCSSFAGLVYRCFGIFTPRNSVDMPHAGGLRVLDVRSYSDSQKAQLLIDHPGAILGWPGHVMLSSGVISTDSGAKAGIIHCNTAYYDAPDGDPSHLIITEKVVEAAASETYRENGESFLTRTEYMIWLEPDLVE